MTEIFAERRLTEGPISERAFKLTAHACLDVHRVECRQSMLALGGERMLCHFRAPDLESARSVLRQYDADFDAVWGATIYEAEAVPVAETAVAQVLEEARYSRPIDIAELESEDDAATHYLAAHDIWRLRTIVSFDQRSVLRIYRAPDADTVRRARREAGVCVDQVWAYRVISGCPLIIGRNHVLSA